MKRLPRYSFSSQPYAEHLQLWSFYSGSVLTGFDKGTAFEEESPTRQVSPPCLSL